MAKPKIKSAFESATSQLFDPKMIYASAFEHAARQIEAALGGAEKVSALIRAQAQELVEFADLLDTTLAAKSEAPDEPKDEPKQEKPAEEKNGEKPAPEPASSPKGDAE